MFQITILVFRGVFFWGGGEREKKQVPGKLGYGQVLAEGMSFGWAENITSLSNCEVCIHFVVHTYKKPQKKGSGANSSCL